MAKPLISNNVYPKNHIKKRKIVEKGKTKQQNFQCRGKGEMVQWGKKRNESLDTWVSERSVRGACSMHWHGCGMLMEKQADAGF